MRRTDAAAGFEGDAGPTIDDVLWLLLDARERAASADLGTMSAIIAAVRRLVDDVDNAIMVAKEAAT